MKKQERLIVKAYIKEHIKLAAVYIMAVAVFWGISGLYGYEHSSQNMLYAAAIALFFGILYSLWDYAGYRQRCLRLFCIVEKVGERDRNLPEAASYQESLYQEMVCEAEEERRRLISELDEKNRDMADYYAMWSHQIKTPIAAMRLLLQEEKQPLEELFKIEQYTEMVLHYARLEGPSSDFLIKEQDVCEIIKQALKKYSILFIGSGLSFAMEPFSCRAVSDEKWLSFVVEQVLSNALKYTPCGSIRIYGLDKERKKTEERADFVVIEDEGIGIRKEDLPRIFERGFTGSNGRMDKRSTGIGLYLCKQVFDKLSHTIEAESEEGKGTRIILGFVQKEI